jgi:four helix bundle protein
MIARKFEDLIFWQKSRELTKLVYTLTRKGEFKIDFALRDQIQRSTVSVMSNIAEGFGRGGNNGFIQFLFTAKGSVAEVQSQLYIAADLEYISDAEFSHAYAMTEEITRMMNSFIKSLKGGNRKGLKTD